MQGAKPPVRHTHKLTGEMRRGKWGMRGVLIVALQWDCLWHLNAAATATAAAAAAAAAATAAAAAAAAAAASSLTTSKLQRRVKRGLNVSCARICAKSAEEGRVLKQSLCINLISGSQ